MEDRFNTPQMCSFEVNLLGHNLHLSQDPNSQHLGTTVWDSSLVFAKFMERNCKKGQFSRSKLAGKRAIELGAGCGLAGLGMALLGCDVVMTDQVEVLPLLLRNVERNLAQARYIASDNPYIGSIGHVEVAELDWCSKSHVAAVRPPFDYVIGTDVVYVEHLLEPLIETILSLVGPKSTVLLGYEFRASGVHEKLHELCNKHFNVKKVLHAKVCSSLAVDRLLSYQCFFTTVVDKILQDLRSIVNMDQTYQHPNIELYIMRRNANSVETFSTAECGGTDSACLPETKPSSASDSKSAADYDNSREASGEEPGTVRSDTSKLFLRSSSSTGDVALEETILSNSMVRNEGSLSLGSSSSSEEVVNWELRRLGSSAARLLSGISISSE